ncbi:MAG: hypothetical protein ACTSYM_11670 [Candidatus Baldrarchaeia archaeon]
MGFQRNTTIIAIVVLFTAAMLLTMETVVAYDKSGYDSSYGWSGEYAKVWTGGETPDKKYYSSCWISFETRGNNIHIGGKVRSLALWI